MIRSIRVGIVYPKVNTMLTLKLAQNSLYVEGCGIPILRNIIDNFDQDDLENSFISILPNYITWVSYLCYVIDRPFMVLLYDNYIVLLSENGWHYVSYQANGLNVQDCEIPARVSKWRLADIFSHIHLQGIISTTKKIFYKDSLGWYLDWKYEDIVAEKNYIDEIKEYGESLFSSSGVYMYKIGSLYIISHNEGSTLVDPDVCIDKILRVSYLDAPWLKDKATVPGDYVNNLVNKNKFVRRDLNELFNIIYDGVETKMKSGSRGNVEVLLV